MWRRPVIIAIQQGNVLSACGTYAAHDNLIAVNVLLGEQQTDLFGMCLLKLNNDLARAIGGAIFADEDLVLKVRLLHRNAVKCLPDELLMVIGHDKNGDFHFYASPGLTARTVRSV